MWPCHHDAPMMTSSKKNISALLALCEGNPPVDCPHKSQWRRILTFLWSTPEQMVEQIEMPVIWDSIAPIMTVMRIWLLPQPGNVYYILPPQAGACVLWRHNERDYVTNHQPHDFLLNRLFRRKSKKTSKLRVTGPCDGNSPATGGRWIPRTKASNAENVSNFNDVFMLL